MSEGVVEGVAAPTQRARVSTLTLVRLLATAVFRGYKPFSFLSVLHTL